VPLLTVEDQRHLRDAWWAGLARRILHPIQVELIETLEERDEPLSARALAGILGIRTAHVLHHLSRLRQVGAIAYCGISIPRNPADIPYRLVLGLGHDGR
jgi:predicted transcriptional regulator